MLCLASIIPLLSFSVRLCKYVVVNGGVSLDYLSLTRTIVQVDTRARNDGKPPRELTLEERLPLNRRLARILEASTSIMASPHLREAFENDASNQKGLRPVLGAVTRKWEGASRSLERAVRTQSAFESVLGSGSVDMFEGMKELLGDLVLFRKIGKSLQSRTQLTGATVLRRVSYMKERLEKSSSSADVAEWRLHALECFNERLACLYNTANNWAVAALFCPNERPVVVGDSDIPGLLEAVVVDRCRDRFVDAALMLYPDDAADATIRGQMVRIERALDSLSLSERLSLKGDPLRFYRDLKIPDITMALDTVRAFFSVPAGESSCESDNSAAAAQLTKFRTRLERQRVEDLMLVQDMCRINVTFDEMLVILNDAIKEAGGLTFFEAAAEEEFAEVEGEDYADVFDDSVDEDDDDDDVDNDLDLFAGEFDEELKSI